MTCNEKTDLRALFRRWRWVGCLVLPSGVWAQPSAPPPTAAFGLSPFVATGETVAQYPTPTECVAAVLREEQRADRTVAAQERMFVGRPDTLALAPAALRTAQACSARWTAASVPAVQLAGLIRVALMANDDAKATAALFRWQREAPDPFERATRLVQSMRWETWSRPMTPARLQVTAAIMDSLRVLGRAVPKGSLAAEEVCFGFYLVGQAYGKMGEDSLLVADMDTAIDLMTTIETKAQYYEPHWQEGLEVLSMGLATEKDYKFSAPHSGAKWAAMYSKWERTFDILGKDNNQKEKEAWDDLSADLTQASNATEVQKAWAQISRHHKDKAGPFQMEYGKFAEPCPPDTATGAVWLRRPDTTVTYPRPGIPTIVATINAECGDDCYPSYAEYKRLYARYASQGFDVILHVYNFGEHDYYISRDRWQLSLPLAPAQVLDSLTNYVEHRLQMPGILKVGAADNGLQCGPEMGQFGSFAVIFPNGLGENSRDFSGKDLGSLSEELFRKAIDNQIVTDETKGNLR